jgi:hypothetical protein
MPSIAQKAARRRSIEANLFPHALEAVEPWNEFPWHGAAGESCDTFKEHSSQALAIDVFGTLKQQPDRDVVLDAVAARLGLPGGGPWRVDLEWRDPDNLLKEKTRTRVDAAARGAHSLILFECKFSEHDGGNCSQTHKVAKGKHKGMAPCTGWYQLQTNPANGKEARCALTAKKIKYWDHIPAVFGYAADVTLAPCPFAGAWFQWMRNLTTCRAVGQQYGLKPAFAVVYADGPGLSMASRIGSAEWLWLKSRVDPAEVTFEALSYQALVALAQRASPASPVWPELAAWVNRKISSVCGPQEMKV